MKKIFIILLMFPLLLKGQVIYNTSDNAYDDYHDYLENGNWRSAEATEKNVLRTADLMLMMLWASAVGYSTDSISALLAKLNALSYHGETFTTPSFSYDATIADFDTIVINRASDRDIELYGDIYKTDRGLLFSYPYGTYDTLRISIGSSGTGIRIRLNDDDAYVGIQDDGIALNKGTSGGLLWWDGTDLLLNTDTVFVKGDTITLSNRIDAKLSASDTTSLSARIDLKLTATDTSSLSTRIDNLAPSGNQYVLQLSNGDGTFTSDGDYTIEDDSARFKHMVLSNDLRLAKFGGSDTNGIYLKPNNVVDTMQWARSSWALGDIEPFKVFFNNRDSLGELNWPRWKGDSYHKINPMYSYDQFTVAHERTWVYINELYEKNKSLKITLIILIVVFGGYIIIKELK